MFFPYYVIFRPIYGHSVSFDGLERENFQRLPTFYLASVKIRRQAKTTDG